MNIRTYKTEYFWLDYRFGLTPVIGPDIEKFCVVNRGNILKLGVSVYRIIEVVSSFKDECHTTTIFLEVADLSGNEFIEQHVKAL